MLLEATILDSASLANEILIKVLPYARNWRFWNLKQVGLANLQEKETGLHDPAGVVESIEVIGYGLDWGWAAQDKQRPCAWPKELVTDSERRRCNKADTKMLDASVT